MNLSTNAGHSPLHRAFNPAAVCILCIVFALSQSISKPISILWTHSDWPNIYRLIAPLTSRNTLAKSTQLNASKTHFIEHIQCQCKTTDCRLFSINYTTTHPPLTLCHVQFISMQIRRIARSIARSFVAQRNRYLNILIEISLKLMLIPNKQKKYRIKPIWECIEITKIDFNAILMNKFWRHSDIYIYVLISAQLCRCRCCCLCDGRVFSFIPYWQNGIHTSLMRQRSLRSDRTDAHTHHNKSIKGQTTNYIWNNAFLCWFVSFWNVPKFYGYLYWYKECVYMQLSLLIRIKSNDDFVFLVKFNFGYWIFIYVQMEFWCFFLFENER